MLLTVCSVIDSESVDSVIGSVIVLNCLHWPVETSKHYFPYVFAVFKNKHIKCAHYHKLRELLSATIFYDKLIKLLLSLVGKK